MIFLTHVVAHIPTASNTLQIPLSNDYSHFTLQTFFSLALCPTGYHSPLWKSFLQTCTPSRSIAIGLALEEALIFPFSAFIFKADWFGIPLSGRPAVGRQPATKYLPSATLNGRN